MMEIFSFFSGLIYTIFDLIFNLEEYLPQLTATYGDLVYGMLFLIIFCETGFVVTPFLPGDSLLFITGTIAGTGNLNISLLIPLIILAAILGDTVNYLIGKFVGTRILAMNLPMIRKENLDATHQYFEKYGGLTIIIARFIPFIRTFAPFLAGIGTMRYRTFLSYNIIGGILWVTLFLSAGYLLGSVPLVQDNMGIIGIIIILISFVAIGGLLIEVCRFFGSCMFRRKNP